MWQQKNSFDVEKIGNVDNSLKNEQEHAQSPLKQLYDGKYVAAVLPTGFGKGHIYQATVRPAREPNTACHCSVEA